jgi:hypothetical protein
MIAYCVDGPKDGWEIEFRGTPPLYYKFPWSHVKITPELDGPPWDIETRYDLYRWNEMKLQFEWVKRPDDPRSL